MERLRFHGQDVLVYYEPLPKRIKAFTTVCELGYAVVIDANLTPDMTTRCLAHELVHIARNDLHSDEPVLDIERRMNDRELQYFIERIEEWMEMGA